MAYITRLVATVVVTVLVSTPVAHTTNSPAAGLGAPSHTAGSAIR